MRICLVTIVGYPHGIGGMQDHTCDLARGLAAGGHDVEVVTAAHPEGVTEETRDGVLWRFVAGAPHHMDRGWMRESAAAVEAAHRARPFDVVHGQGSSALGLLRRGFHRTTPLVVMFHGNFASLARASARRAFARGTPVAIAREAKLLFTLGGEHFPHGNWYRFRACEAIVPSRQQLADTRRSHLLRADRVHVVPNGVDASRFSPRPSRRAELGLPEGLLFVCVGRLNHEKGFHHAVHGIAALVDAGHDAYLAIVGDGEERERLSALAAARGIGDRVVFAGRQSPTGVAAHLASADAFLFPTEREEAAPLVLPQAMASGLAVVASSIGGITEVVDRPDENGILVPPGDTAALGAAMARLAGDVELRARLGAAARRRVLEEYTVELMTARTLRVYEIARERQRGAGPQESAVPAVSRKASRA
jgi:glycosyltransferase involved in cell wall biosynthesis